MPLYNLLEYSDNYADFSGSLWPYKNDEKNMAAAGNPDNSNTNDSSLFKYKSNFLKDLTSRAVAANTDSNTAAGHRLFTDTKIVVSLK